MNQSARCPMGESCEHGMVQDCQHRAECKAYMDAFKGVYSQPENPEPSKFGIFKVVPHKRSKK